MRNEPKEIFLNITDDDISSVEDVDFTECCEVSWSEEPSMRGVLRYVRSDDESVIGSDLDLARILIIHAVDSILATCGNSYVNAYTEQWLDHARRLGGYSGPVVGNLIEVRERWEGWLDENGGLPEWPDSPAYKKRIESFRAVSGNI